MATRVIDRTGTGGVAPAGLDRGEPYCPECGQSLNLRRGPDGAPPRSTAGWRPLAVVGLCLVLLFGIRTWQARGALASLDREIADRRAATGHDVFGPPSNQAMVQAEAIEPVLPDRAPLQRRLRGDLTGLALGLIGLVAGAGTRRGPLLRLVGLRQRGNFGTDHASPPRDSLVRSATTLWASGSALAGAFFRVLLILFGCTVAAQLVRGVPPSLDLVDQALARTVEIVSAAAGSLG